MRRCRKKEDRNMSSSVGSPGGSLVDFTATSTTILTAKAYEGGGITTVTVAGVAPFVVGADYTLKFEKRT
jgi:hypothetical protein